MGRNGPQLVAGADLGGTNLRMALVSGRGEILGRFRRGVPAGRTVMDVVATLDEGCQALREQVPGGVSLSCLGIGVPGLVDPTKGLVATLPNFPAWRDVPLKAELEGRLGMPVHVENDVNAIAVGELHYGAARGALDVLMVTLGTGVGGGIILGGKLRRGPDGTAGEVGHITVRPGGRRCGCGNRGCLESYASASAIVSRAAALGLSTEQEGAAGVAELARAGDRRARRVFVEAARALGTALAGVANLLNLERAVIGGGVARSWDLLEPVVYREVRRRAFDLPARRLHIVASELLDDAGIVGAARLALDANTPSFV